MKRRPAAAKSKKNRKPTGPARSARTTQIPEAKLYTPPLALKLHRRVSYVPGELPKEESQDAIRLFIRGAGGSIKMDLRGVGTRLSPVAFAYQVPDDLLADIRIYRDDIIIIEPFYRALHERNLVLLEVDGRSVLKQLTKKKRLWYLNSLGDSGPEPIPLVDRPLQGVVVGLVRLFTSLKPIKFRGAEACSETSFLRFGKDAENEEKSRKAKAKYKDSEAKRAINRRKELALAAEGRRKYCLSEVGKRPPYVTWPNTRRR